MKEKDAGGMGMRVSSCAGGFWTSSLISFYFRTRGTLAALAVQAKACPTNYFPDFFELGLLVSGLGALAIICLITSASCSR